MPWFPDFAGAVELARRETRAAGRADPVAQYLHAIGDGDVHGLETAWPGTVVVHDPRGGEVRGHRHLHQFIGRSTRWLAQRDATIETVAAMSVGGRAVVELVAHLHGAGAGEAAELLWPVAVVAESPDELSAVFRVYCSQWPVDGQRHVRPALLEPGATRPDGVVGRFHAALGAGDTEAVVGTFAPDGYLREPVGPPYVHRGSAELREYFRGCFGSGGGISLEQCTVTDDGVRCAVEYNCVRWGSHELPAQAGVAVYERGPDGLLAAVRVYDDVVPPGAPG